MVRDSKLLRALCFEEYSTKDTPRRVIDDANRSSIEKYLGYTPRKATSPAAITEKACHIFTLPRNERRKVLSKITDSERRLLLKEADRIKRRVVDSNLGYDPELCWALQRAVDLNDPRAERIIDSRQAAGTLPYEVEKWYAKYRVNPESLATEDAERSLKPYRVIDDAAPRTRITDSKDSIEKYLDSGEEEEQELNATVDEAVERAQSLSSGAQDRLNDFKDEAKKEVTSCLERIVASLEDIIPDVAAQDAADDGAAAAEAIIEGEGTATEEANGSEGEEFAETDSAFEIGDSAEEEEIFCDDGRDNCPEGTPAGKLKDAAPGDVVFAVGDKVTNRDKTCAQYNYTGEVIDMMDAPGAESVLTVQYDNGLVKMGKPRQFAKGVVTDSAKIKSASPRAALKKAGKLQDNADAPMPPIRVTAYGPGDGVKIEAAELVTVNMSGMPGVLATVAEIDPILRTISVREVDPATLQPKEGAEDIVVSEDVVEQAQIVPIPEEPLTPTEDLIMDDTKGIPTKLIEMFKEGATLKIKYTIKDAKYNQGLLALGKGRLVVTLDGELPRKMFKMFSGQIKDICRQSGFDVDVKFPKMSMSGSDHFEIIFKGKGKTDSAANPLEACAPGDIVSYMGKQAAVDRVSDKSVTLADPDTGRLVVVGPESFGELYLVNKVDRKNDKARGRINDDAASDVRDVFVRWMQENSATLATDTTAESHDDAYRRLDESLRVIDKHFHYSDDIRGIQYETTAFATDDAASINVGGTLFLYQATQEGVDTLAAQVGDAAEALYASVRIEDSAEEDDAYLTEEDVKEVFDSVGIHIADAADASMLTEEAKQEVLNKVQEKILARLKEDGLDVKDSAEGMNWADQGAAALRMHMGIPVKDASGKECKVSGVGRKGYKVKDAAGEEILREYPFDNGATATGRPTIEELNAQIAAAEAETDTNPTEEQRASGDYKKGRVNIAGFDFVIENPKGSIRRGRDADGREWESEIHNTYGYLDGTHGANHDALDVFLGPNPMSESVFVIDQNNADGSFDEHKCMIGFDTAEAACAAYLSNYEEGWESRIGAITKCTLDNFRKWADTHEVRAYPFTDFISISTTPVVTDTMDHNEDGDERITINWSADQMNEYLRRAMERAERLKTRGLADSALPTPDPATHEGSKNHYDLVHTRETFRQVWDSSSELNKVLRSAAKVLGRDVFTADDYRAMLEDPKKFSKELAAVADSAFTLDALGLFNQSLYKRRFADTYWVADSAEDLESSFNLQIPEEYKGHPVMVSTQPFAAGRTPVTDSMNVFPYDPNHHLYMARIDDKE